jgi:hypothetical protein
MSCRKFASKKGEFASDHFAGQVQQDVLELATILNAGEFEARVSPRQGFNCGNRSLLLLEGRYSIVDRHYLGL